MEYRRHRFYDPLTSRFTQEDPIGLAGGLNAYGFAASDPINFSDPFGLCPGVAGTNQNYFGDCPSDQKFVYLIHAWSKPFSRVMEPVASAELSVLMFFVPGGAAAKLMRFGGAAEATTTAARVIGSYGETGVYLQVGEAIGAKIFDIPLKIWNAMSAEAQWAANVKFLDRGIAKGAEFILSTLKREISPISTLQREIDYLLAHGYKWTENFMSLIPK